VDPKDLPDKAQVIPRRQARRWLREQLNLCANAVEVKPSVKAVARQNLVHWQ
jgi:hypothetical protein